MAISSTQYIDLLVKKLLGVTKTDTNDNKSPSNESIASPSLVRGDQIWIRAGDITATAQIISGVTQAYLTTSAVECVADDTAVPVGGVSPTWKTNLTDWIPTDFGSTWTIKVYVDDANAVDPSSTGDEIYAAGTGGLGQYYFDHQAGVLNFIGESIPAVLTSTKRIYVTGYRYVGSKSLSGGGGTGLLGDLAVTGSAIIVESTNSDLTLTPNGDGSVVISGNNGFVPPSGTSEQRPEDPEPGTTRFNTATGFLEFYNGADWVVAGPEAGTITAQTLNGDGSTLAFTLEKSTSTDAVIVSTNGTVQQPDTAYVVSGNTITFAEPPSPGDSIDVRFITLTFSVTNTILPIFTKTETLALTDVDQGTSVLVSDGDAGSPCLAIYNGTGWKKILLTADL